MPSFHVSWNERVFYESNFSTNAEVNSPEWFDAMFGSMDYLDSNGMDDINVEVMPDDDDV